MIYVLDTDPDSLADAAAACRSHANEVLSAALEASRRLESGALGDGDRRTPAVRITAMLARAARLQQVAHRLEDARPSDVDAGADLPPSPELAQVEGAAMPPASAGVATDLRAPDDETDETQLGAVTGSTRLLRRTAGSGGA